MSRIWLLVPLLLATGAAFADDVPERTEPATPAEVQQTAPADDAGNDADANTPAETPAESPDEKTDETPDGTDDGGPKVISGMSILGNQEAPKSLVIVPWKSSEIGDALGIPTMLDDSVQPVDRDVFLRALSYYEIRSETTP
jgi:hypothetical protein